MKSNQDRDPIWVLFILAIAITLAVLKFVAPYFAHLPTSEEMAKVAELFLPDPRKYLQPEPLEQLRYVLGISLYPILLFAALWLLDRKERGTPFFKQAPAAVLTLGLLFFSWNWLVQSRAEYGYVIPTLASLGLSLAMGGTLYVYRKRQWTMPTSYPAAAACIAGAYVLIRLIPAIVTEGNISEVPRSVWHHIPFAMSEFSAISNGRTLLVDFFPQYMNFFPYLFIPLFSFVGMSVTHFTLFLFALSGLCFAVVFWVFLRSFGNCWKALLVFLPFVALALVPLPKDPHEANPEVIHIFNYFTVGPLRYFGPLFSLYALGKYLRGPSLKRLLLVGILAGASALNNPDFGVPAFVACAASILLSRTAVSNWLKTGTVFLGGALLPLFALLLITLYRTGEMPLLAKVLAYQRIFALYGFNMMPMEPFGSHLNVIATYLICLTLAIHSFFSHRKKSAQDRFTTGMLAFVAVFGCGSLMYFIGRSHPNVLVSSFMVWGMAWALLLCYFLNHRQGLNRYSQTVVAALFIVGSAPMILEIPHIVPIDYQVRRLRFENRFQAEDTAHSVLCQIAATGANSLIFLYPYSHYFADKAGLNNLSPVAQKYSIILWTQWDEIEKVAQKNKVKWIAGIFIDEMKDRLRALGYQHRFTKDDAEAWSL